MEESQFGRMPDGSSVKIYTLTNVNGMKAKVTEYGATLTELWVPDRDGTLTDVVLDCIGAALGTMMYVEARYPSTTARGIPMARCNDGTISYSQHSRGTCSHHGGVASWLR